VIQFGLIKCVYIFTMKSRKGMKEEPEVGFFMLFKPFMVREKGRK